MLSAQRLIDYERDRWFWSVSCSGDNGELRLGVRRANKLQPNGRSSVFNMVTSESVHLGVLAAASHAAKEKLRFKVIYSPRFRSATQSVLG